MLLQGIKNYSLSLFPPLSVSLSFPLSLSYSCCYLSNLWNVSVILFHRLIFSSFSVPYSCCIECKLHKYTVRIVEYCAVWKKSAILTFCFMYQQCTSFYKITQLVRIIDIQTVVNSCLSLYMNILCNRKPQTTQQIREQTKLRVTGLSCFHFLLCIWKHIVMKTCTLFHFFHFLCLRLFLYCVWAILTEQSVL